VSFLNSDLKFDRYETLNRVLMDTITAYPEAILWELLSYSKSICQYFNVKEIFKQVQRKQTSSGLKCYWCINFLFGGKLTLAVEFRLYKLKHCFGCRTQVLLAEMGGGNTKPFSVPHI